MMGEYSKGVGSNLIGRVPVSGNPEEVLNKPAVLIRSEARNLNAKAR